ncbi:MAG: cyclic nucleotide-binding domain-containing protein [Pseudobdellovibrionaceae bacterium]|nr:cyclic nucleotide-binding domain-containing protein [Bdellovibrionales bacterium]USN48956.1 MAG: cyclic nucleotide-binding domain-containing protein [Pseudobdellovibrionaceae bacterium]
MDELHFQKGDYLFIEGDETQFFYIIKSGKVEIFMTDDEGSKIPLAVVDDGQAIGEFALLLEEPRSATAQALTDVVCIKIAAEGYKSLLETLPDWAASILESLVVRLKATDEIIRKAKIVDKDLEKKIEELRGE